MHNQFNYEETDPAKEVKRVQEQVEEVLRQVKFLSKTQPSRELSLVITKLEEACLWFTTVG